jgi:DNA-binding transcriptional LysR family regulator
VNSSLTLRHLRYFIATAETGKIQLAAEKVHMSPSAVADAIKSLESILCINLFDRHRSGVSLTYDGHRFLDSAYRILNMVDDSIFAFQNQKKNIEGQFILGASVSVVGYFLPIPLGQFERIYPKVKVNIVENSRDILERQLRAQEIDIAFMITSNIKAADGLEIETLFRSERTLWCAESHRFAKMDKVPLAEIAKESYIMLVSDEAESNTNQFWKRFALEPNVRIKTQSVEAVRGFIAREKGVAILSNLLYRPWSLDGTRILSKQIEEPIPTMNLGVVWNSNKPLPLIQQQFIDFLKQDSWRL